MVMEDKPVTMFPRYSSAQLLEGPGCGGAVALT